MRTLLAITMLVTLVSCGEAVRKLQSFATRNTLTTSIGTVERGTIVNEAIQGTTLSYDEGRNKFVINIYPANLTTVKVLVAIEKSKLFFMERNTGKKRVVTEKVPTQAEIEEMLASPENARNGNYLNFIRPSEDEREARGMITVHYSSTQKGMINLMNYFCDSEVTHTLSDIVQTDAVFTTTTTLGSASSSVKKSCAGMMPKDELKALDLRAVEFCDYAAEKDCVQDQNMMGLISDLQ